MQRAVAVSYLKVWLLWTFLWKEGSTLKKHWLPDVEWQTKENWDRLPGNNDRVIFPLGMRHAVGMPSSGEFILSQIDLPWDGSLVFLRNGKLQLNDRAKGKTARWLKQGRFFWADPNNWNGTSEATPHFERVPCRQDDVVLPATERTFSMILPVKDVEVRSVKMSNEKYVFAWWEWDDLMRKREFSGGASSVRYSQYSCEKCLCQGNSQSDYLEEICAIEKPKCAFAPCDYPMWIEGHCCLFCGGRMTLSKDVSLVLVRSLADEQLENWGAIVAWYVRRSSRGNIEILLSEKGDYSGVRTLEAIENLRKRLEAEGIEVLYAEDTGAPLKDSPLSTVLGSFLGIPLALLLLLIALFWYFGYSFRYVLSQLSDVWSSIQDGKPTNKSSKPFGFARFENVPDGNVQIKQFAIPNDEESEESEEVLEAAIKSSSSRKFENPLYSSKRGKSNIPMKKKELIDVDAPLSLTDLKSRIKDDNEEIEADNK